MEHAWKVCRPLKGLQGSNPCLSACCPTEFQANYVPAIQKFAECSSIDAAKARSRQVDAFMGR